MRTLYLIKHGAPEFRSGVSAHEWTLSDEGRTQALGLAGRLRGSAVGAVVTSEEPKAIETGRVLAEGLGVALQRGLGLHEQLRYTQPWFTSRAEFERQIGELFARPSERVLGDESADDAHTRFSNAVRATLRITEGDVALVAHGTVIALLVARANQLDAWPLWNQLGFCDFYAVRASDLRRVQFGPELIHAVREEKPA